MPRIGVRYCLGGKRSQISRRAAKRLLFHGNRLGTTRRRLLPPEMCYTARVLMGYSMRDWTADEIAAIAERLRQARIRAGFQRAADAVRKFGWSYSRYMNYENGGRAIPPKQAILFASAYGVSVDFIYFGKDDILNRIETPATLKLEPVRRIALVALGNIADLKRIVSGLEPMVAVTIPIAEEDEALAEHVIFIAIEDKSMSSPGAPISFEPGDRALIDLDAIPEPSDFVLALVPEERTALFRMYREVGRSADGTMIVDLVPLNPNFRTIRLPGSGQIVGVCRRVDRSFYLSPAGSRSRLG
jgi:transcriptional regulator with XRE-family HTH domain